jgi:putative ABC transport system substrate-binding protein
MVVKSTVARLAAAAVLLLAGSVAAQAQQAARVYRIGFVSPTSPFPGHPSHAFLQGLRELGYVEGQNVMVEVRFAEGRSERLPELVAEAIRLKVDVLVVGSTPGALAAKRATTAIPIVFAGVPDPVAQGIVASLARPGGNITGISMAIGEGFAGKWVELLKEAAPNISHVAALWNSTNPAATTFVKEVQAAARALNVRLDVFAAGNLSQLDGAFAAIGAGGARGVIVTADPFFFSNRATLVQFASSRRLPAMYFTKDFVDAGGLMAYGPSLATSYRRAATYVDKILKGAKPADLPIEQPTRLELVINRASRES